MNYLKKSPELKDNLEGSLFFLYGLGKLFPRPFFLIYTQPRECIPSFHFPHAFALFLLASFLLAGSDDWSLETEHDRNFQR